MKNRFFLVVATVAAVALMTSCAKVPQANIDAANTAIDSAKTAQADIYLPGEFTALNDSMTVIMQSIEAQKSKLFKSYKAPKAKLVALRTQASQVAANAVTKKEEVKKEAEAGLAAVKQLLADDQALLKKAPRGKEGKAVLDEIKGELSVIETSINEAQTAFDGGANYMAVVDKVKAANDQLNNIKTELDDAIAKVKKR